MTSLCFTYIHSIRKIRPAHGIKAAQAVSNNVVRYIYATTRVKSTIPSGSSENGTEKRNPITDTDGAQQNPLTIMGSVVLMEQITLHVELGLPSK